MKFVYIVAQSFAAAIALAVHYPERGSAVRAPGGSTVLSVIT